MSSQPNKHSARNAVEKTGAIVTVLLLSLLLLIYMGLGEVYRTYVKFEMDTLSAQNKLIQGPLQSFLLAGLPVELFPGFSLLTQTLLDSDTSIVGLYISDTKERIVFANLRSEHGVTEDSIVTDFHDSKIENLNSEYAIAENSSFYRVSLELHDKFEAVGDLNIIMAKSTIRDKIYAYFIPVAYKIGMIVLLFALITFYIFKRPRQQRWLSITYAIAYTVAAAILVAAMVNIYADGIERKTKALALSLTQRLNAPLQLGLSLSDFDELEEMFKEYRIDDPNLLIALSENTRYTLHTTETEIGATLRPIADSFVFICFLEGGNTRSCMPQEILSAQQSKQKLHVGVPNKVIYEKLQSSIRNFAVLFIASAFLSKILFELIGTLMEKARRSITDENMKQHLQEKFRLGTIQPLYYMGVFVFGLPLSFLPKYFSDLAQIAHANPTTVSALFTVFFASYAIALVPAGRYADRKGVKPVLVAAAVLIFISMLIMISFPDIYVMFLSQTLNGLAQGMLFIGVQSYVLAAVSGTQRTKGAAVIVFSYNGGLISGLPIGALLAVYTDVIGVFTVGATIALLMIVYSFFLVPKIETSPAVATRVDPTKQAGQQLGLLQELSKAFSDFDFMRTALLIGVPAKIIMAGVISFSMPLLLVFSGYTFEEVGQILMFYYASLLLTSHYISRLTDRIGHTTTILAIGAVLSGVGLFTAGLGGLEIIETMDIPYIVTAVILLGLTVLGIGHAFIQAPIVTHMSNTPIAASLGTATTTSLYRLIERVGNIAGPIVVSFLLLIFYNSLYAISVLGCVTVVFGMLFILSLLFAKHKNT